MNVFKLRRARRLGGLLAGLGALVTMLVVTGTAALAMVDPGTDGGGVDQPPPPLAPAAGGMPGWQITLIAVGAALVAAVLAVLADRARSARRRPAVASAASNVPAQVSKVR
jgi:MFS family permease